ncbi:outer membrane beta-barrel protein [Pontimicrobium aquaticum]|uniref:Cell envelope biogenesis protein OmpA n=1 Tax=Pontimicrobium aquaticum TaxID=2565367 RepID=A0A4U0F0Y6_9FLAO|nr:outer membrane beta-barrel protein [Pontimicrobium aquaticum]TJY37900.1 cell envelope biogenesis protein OmpA [Pontimicrobium aquaticum]
MTFIKNKYKRPLLCLLLFSVISFSFAQGDSEKIRLQLAVGVNNPIDNGKNDGYFAKDINLPTINFGVRYMFKPNKLGAKLDVGYNRSKSDEGSQKFKLNYTRVNAQVVYDFNDLLSFLPQEMSIQAHAGPGVSFTKPLLNDSENTYTYLNGLIGLEVYYSLSRKLSLFVDVAYAKSFTNKVKYDVVTDGYSFNGDLMYATVGLSVALSGCRYCN